MNKPYRVMIDYLQIGKIQERIGTGLTKEELSITISPDRSIVRDQDRIRTKITYSIKVVNKEVIPKIIEVVEAITSTNHLKTKDISNLEEVATKEIKSHETMTDLLRIPITAWWEPKDRLIKSGGTNNKWSTNSPTKIKIIRTIVISKGK